MKEKVQENLNKWAEKTRDTDTRPKHVIFNNKENVVYIDPGNAYFTSPYTDIDYEVSEFSESDLYEINKQLKEILNHA